MRAKNSPGPIIQKYDKPRVYVEIISNADEIQTEMQPGFARPDTGQQPKKKKGKGFKRQAGNLVEE